MKKLLKIFIAFLLIAFVIMQFFQPKKNISKITENHILEKEYIPKNIESILKNACLDCHSNQTNYLWYHNISPVSWMVNKHVVAGKSELNLSDWGELDLFGKIAVLDDICTEVEHKRMPLKEYTLIHKEAKLSDEQIAELCAWTEKMGLKILASIEN